MTRGLSAVNASVGRVAARFARVALAFALLLCDTALDVRADPGALRAFDLGIVKRRIEGNVNVIRVERADTVMLRWRTDEAVTIHVHGYDLHAQLPAMAQTDMRFRADIAGRFAITAHAFGVAAPQSARPKQHRETTLLYLEVHPR